ncbi:MAG: MFS transporter [Deltaproteobacteria bacterium]|nr:MFS transporter [Deltaproteobacteria bacterium]
MSSTPSKPASFRWTILAIISVSHIIGATAQYGINTLAPFYRDDLQLSRAQIGLFFTAFYMGMAGLSYAAGWLADRLGVRATVLSGHLILGLWTIAAASAPSFGWAFGSFFLAGLGYSFLNPASTKGVMAWFYRDERATAMGIKQTGVPTGGVVAAVLGPSLVLLVGWRGALAGLGVINLLFGFFFWSLWREPPGETGSSDSPDLSTPESHAALRVKNLLSVSFGTALLLVGQMTLLTYVPLFLKETMGLSAYWASQALALTQMGAMMGRIGWGVVSDRLFQGRRKIVLVLIGALSVALTLALGLLPRAAPLFFVLPLIFLAGVCMVGYQGVSYALIGEIAGKARTGAALGIVITVNSLGTIFGTPLFGYLVDATGSYSIAWQALAGAILLGILALAFFLKEPNPDLRATL